MFSETELKLEKSWFSLLSHEIEQPYFRSLREFLRQENDAGHQIYPPENLIFNAFRFTPYDRVKVVIIGQDPYHGPHQAHGLSFSVPIGITPPPSLKNVFKELQDDLALSIPSHGCLVKWAEQGVLLLNATLTVREGEPKSHYGKGWETFTDAVVCKLKQKPEPLIFVLWGKSAQEKYDHLNTSLNDNHLVLKAAHPSPFSAHSGFLGCRHFSKINDFLSSHNITPIDWSLI
ncbi:MAG: uracil-DNA glycosylase [Rhabdochlamydiaceae bacterium]